MAIIKLDKDQKEKIKFLLDLAHSAPEMAIVLAQVKRISKTSVEMDVRLVMHENAEFLKSLINQIPNVK